MTSISELATTPAGFKTSPTGVSIPYQLAHIVQDMEKAIKAELYYPALLVALTLPDVCSALALPADKFVKEEHYVKFINTYAPRLGLGGQQCYRLRGGVVHRGNAAGHPFFGKSHVVFSTPQTGLEVHSVTFDNPTTPLTAIMLDVTTFCGRMKDAVIDWFIVNGADPLVQANIPAILSQRPNGFPPWIEGVPVIASGT